MNNNWPLRQNRTKFCDRLHVQRSKSSLCSPHFHWTHFHRPFGSSWPLKIDLRCGIRWDRRNKEPWKFCVVWWDDFLKTFLLENFDVPWGLFRRSKKTWTDPTPEIISAPSKSHFGELGLQKGQTLVRHLVLGPSTLYLRCDQWIFSLRFLFEYCTRSTCCPTTLSGRNFSTVRCTENTQQRTCVQRKRSIWQCGGLQDSMQQTNQSPSLHTERRMGTTWRLQKRKDFELQLNFNFAQRASFIEILSEIREGTSKRLTSVTCQGSEKSSCFGLFGIRRSSRWKASSQSRRDSITQY